METPIIGAETLDPADHITSPEPTAPCLTDKMKPWISEALAPYAAERIEWDLVAGFHPEMGAVLNLILWVPSGIVGQVGNHLAMIQGPTLTGKTELIDMVRQQVEEVLSQRSASLSLTPDQATQPGAVADLLRKG